MSDEGAPAKQSDAVPQPANASKPTDPPAVGASRAPARKKRLRPVILLLLLLAGAGSAFWYFRLRQPVVVSNVIAVSGRLESDDAAVAAKASGRVREINVREGDAVKAGQVLALIDDEQARAREEQAQANVTQAEARIQRARQQIAVLQAQLEQAGLGIEQARLDAQGRVAQAEAQVAAAEAQLAQAEANYKQAKYDEEKFGRLYRSGDISERQATQARTAAEAQADIVRAQRKQVEVARGALTAARANFANPRIRAAQASAVQEQITQAQSDIASAQADAERARAQLREAQANRGDLTIVAPFDGTITTRSVEPGEVVAAGAALCTLVNLNAVYLRGYVPEGDIGRVRLGQPVRVYLDSQPNQPLEAEVSRIDPEASFTPENTYFRNDRVKQVVGVKLLLKAPQGYAKPGMPADGEILVTGSWPAQRSAR